MPALAPVDKEFDDAVVVWEEVVGELGPDSAPPAICPACEVVVAEETGRKAVEPDELDEVAAC